MLNTSVMNSLILKLLSPNSTAIFGEASDHVRLATDIADSLIPYYGFLSRFIQEFVGFGPTDLIPVAILLFMLKHLWRGFVAFFKAWLSATIILEEHDQLFRKTLDWSTRQSALKRARHLQAVSRRNINQHEEESTESYSPEPFFHFGKWDAEKPPTYQPPVETTFWIWWRRHLFIVERRRVRSQATILRDPEKEYVVFRTPGFSTRPIQMLIQEIKRSDVRNLTTAKYPSSKESSRFRSSPWTVVSVGPARHIESVYLAQQKRGDIVNDMNAFLLPKNERWYKKKGIPYRRGYLFYGPPGTGKTSLSVALAGLFGLDIHVISLVDFTLTDGDLNHLFNNLPQKSIVLLEDIDCAHLRRHDEESSTDKGISLSGLFNAIDGAATNEGRLLIMTTNHRDRLDEALTRPGRVDMEVEFNLASRKQIHDMFTMFFDEYEPKGDENIASMAKKFSELVPAEKISTAEIQNFLIARKTEPKRVILEGKDWAENILKDKG